MNKGKQLYWVDVGLAISFILCFITGIFKWPTLYKYFFSWPMKQISIIHDWSGLIMGLLVLIHLIQHWKWIVVMTKKMWWKND